MKKILSAILIFSMLSFSACSEKDKTSSSDTQNSSEENSSSQLESSSQNDSTVEHSTETTAQAMQETLKLIPENFNEAIEIETKRQAVLIDGCGATIGNATYTAFGEMKDLYDTYCNKVLEKLDENQRTLFKDMLAKEKQYNISFDMFSHNALQQYVYTNGNATCNQDYNIIRTKSVLMYYYYNILTNNEIDKDNYKNVLNENFDSFFFFNPDLDIIKEKSNTELISIDNEYSPLLRIFFEEDSQPVFDDYKTSFNEYISSLKTFEKSIDETGQKIDNSVFYYSLNSAFIFNLYDSIKDMEYPDDMLEMFNLNNYKDKFIAKWE